MKYMIDTNTSIHIMKNKPEYIKNKFLKVKPENLLLSNISLSELFFGVYKSENFKKNLRVLEKFLLGLEVVDYDFNASIEYGKIKSKLVNENKNMSNIDIQIAAHAVSLNSILITNEIKKFNKVKGIKLENWIDA